MGARLLIADDEAEIREMLSRHFRLQGFEVDLAENGRAALDVLAGKRIDIVISDIRMPVMDGAALLSAIRSQYPMVRVIMITGYVTLENALTCLRRGAETCVFKPLDDLAELDQAVQQALDRLKSWQMKLRELQGMKPGGKEA